MKLFSLAVCSLLLGLSFLDASPLDRKGDAKITKNEAEHIALRQYPGARVTAAKLETIEGALVWSIEISQPKLKESTMVAVNARSGRIVPGKNGDR